MALNFEVVVGTYEQFLLGYKIDQVVNEYKMEQTFATHSHLASIRSVASNKHYLASAGADEVICLYDMRYRTANGKLEHHNDSVNCITFTPDASHILTGGKDGLIGVVRCGNWQIEKLWEKPHKGFPIEALAVHPSGKLALSTGGDGVLRTWNLVKGKQAYATNLVPRWKMLAKSINILKWSPNGEKYLIASNNKIDIYSVETAGVDEEMQLDSKIICAEFLNDDLIAIGFDNGRINFYDLEESSKTLDIVAHDARLKCMQHFDDFLVTASSTGEIKLWQFTKDSLTLLSQVTCNSRILCLAVASVCQNLKSKKESKKEEAVEEKRVNKLRIRQEVIIEDEENIPAEVKSVKKKSKVRLNDYEEEENSPVSKKKKKKLNGFTVEDGDNSCHGVKRSSDDECQTDDTQKKKKIKVKENDECLQKKRKESNWTEEEINTPQKKVKTNKSFEDNKSKSKNTKEERKKKVPTEKECSPKAKVEKDLNERNENLLKKNKEERKKKKNKKFNFK